MRICFVNSAWPGSWGGGEKWTIDAARWFEEHGHSPLVVGRPGSKLVHAAWQANLSATETPFGGDYDPLAMLRAREILREHKSQIAVVNFNKEAWQFGIAARLLKIPAVARHGFPLLSNKLRHKLLLSRVLTKVVANAGSIVEQYHRESLPVDGIEIIHNGTAVVAQKTGELRARFGIAKDELLLMGAGRLESQKRFDRFLNVAETLLTSYPDTRFLIAGEGPLGRELQSMITARGLGERVLLAGFVPDFAAVAGDADLFLLTSEEEGTPNALLEAMAAGVPCLSFAVGSVPEIFHGELSGYSISAGDSEEMSLAASRLLGDRTLLAQAGAAMRGRVEREFSRDSSMMSFERLFQQLVSSTI